MEIHVQQLTLDNSYLLTMPLEPTSISLKRAVEKNDGSLQISLVTGLNSGIPQETNENKLLTSQKDKRTEIFSSKDYHIQEHISSISHRVFAVHPCDHKKTG